MSRNGSMPVWPGPMGPPTDNRGPAFLAICFTQWAVATIVVLGRLYARRRYKGRFYADDWLMFIAWVSVTIYTAFLPVVTNLGFGRHVYYLKPAKLIKFSRIFYIVNPFFNVASFFSRASFAMSLLMIMGTSLPRKAILWFTIAHQLVFHVIVLFIRQFRCNPIKKSWLIMIPGKCLGRSWIRIPSALYASSNIVADLTLGLMPALIISQLNIRKSLKIGLILLMSVGLLNTAAACITLATIFRDGDLRDFTYDTFAVNIWAATQIYLALILGSIPFLRPLFVNNKFLQFSFYRAILSGRSFKSTSKDTDTLVNSSKPSKKKRFSKHGTPQSLPRVDQDRFVTTTLRNAGPGMLETEKGDESLSTIDEASSLDKKPSSNSKPV